MSGGSAPSRSFKRPELSQHLNIVAKGYPPLAALNNILPKNDIFSLAAVLTQQRKNSLFTLACLRINGRNRAASAGLDHIENNIADT